MSKTEKEKMLAGEMYNSGDPELVAERRNAKQLYVKYNHNPVDLDKALLSALFGYETDAHIEAPIRVDYGYNIRIGRNFFANYNFIILDPNTVTIGDNVLIAPNVLITTAGHPVDPKERMSGLEFAKPVTIGNNVWIGAGVTILPGVEIGDHATIGAGSIVNKSIPANTVAAGNPCKVVRKVDDGMK